jgi:Mrp family chromosome partitioning ATPase
MSRNFELLQRLGFEEQVIAPAPVEPARRPRREVVPRATPLPGDPHATSIVQRLFLTADGAAPAALSLISLDPRKRDTLCARIAETLAGYVSGEVCLVDADVEHPAVHAYFRLANDRGLAQALVSPGEISTFLRPVPGTQLTVLPAGHGTGAVICGERLAERVRELRENFDYVLVRAPLGVDAADACFLGRLTGSAVLVIEANATRRDAAARLKLQLEHNGVSVLGAVLNNRTFPIPSSLYSKLF